MGLTTQILLNEFQVRVFDESMARIEKCLISLLPDRIWYQNNENTVSIGCLVKHLIGNARQWILSGVYGQQDIRERETEFLPSSEMDCHLLLMELFDLRDDLRDALHNKDAGDLNRKIVIQGFHTTPFSAFVHVIEHFSYHTGQITLLTKLDLDIDLGYYQGFSLN